MLDRLLAAEKMTRADLRFQDAVERSEFDLAAALAEGGPMSASALRPPRASSGSISCR